MFKAFLFEENEPVMESLIDLNSVKNARDMNSQMEKFADDVKTLIQPDLPFEAFWYVEGQDDEVSKLGDFLSEETSAKVYNYLCEGVDICFCFQTETHNDQVFEEFEKFAKERKQPRS